MRCELTFGVVALAPNVSPKVVMWVTQVQFLHIRPDQQVQSGQRKHTILVPHCGHRLRWHEITSRWSVFKLQPSDIIGPFFASLARMLGFGCGWHR